MKVMPLIGLWLSRFAMVATTHRRRMRGGLPVGTEKYTGFYFNGSAAWKADTLRHDGLVVE